MPAPLKLGALLLALASLTSIAAPALADDDWRGRGRGHDRHYDRDHDRHDRYDRRDRHDRHDRRHAYRRDYRDGYRHDRRDDRVYYAPYPVYRDRYYYVAPRPAYHRGPPPWARGRHYRYRGYGPTYVVRDYRPYGLWAPPRGHYWRRSDAGDFLLVAIATGIIADVILR